jgi:hypothetical protein
MVVEEFVFCPLPGDVTAEDIWGVIASRTNNKDKRTRLLLILISFTIKLAAR